MNKQTLYKFFEGTTSHQEEELIRKWLEESPAHKAVFMKERKIYDSILLLNDKTLDTFASRRFVLPRVLTEVIKIASVVILTLTVDYLYTQWERSEKPVPMQVVSVPAGQRINITLPDGTDVWLNAMTTIRYPAVFADDLRQVELDGEAWFEVTRNNRQPFIVKTDKGEVEVLGTTFNLRDYASRDRFETTLISGSVRLVSGADPDHSVILSPHTKGSLEDGVFTVVEVTDFNEYRWKEGMICFKDDSFETIMEEFERYFGMTIRVNNPQALTYSYTGKFRQSDGIDYALNVLQKYVHFSYQRDEENQLITIE